VLLLSVMAPKKASPDALAVEPRRSGRIASKSDAPSTEATLKPKTSRATKKSPAEEATMESAEASSSKKTKPDDQEADEQQEDSDALSAIDIGDSLPRLVLKDEKGEDIQVADLAAEKGAILFLVPKADTPGCTTQACAFRDVYPDFTSLNYIVYCLSADSPSAQTKWQTKKELPYPLISDPKRILITALGAGHGGKTTRSHFIFEKGGKLVDRRIPVKPADSSKFALEFIQGKAKL